MPGFENGVVLITGAGSGIGQGILLEFIKAGCITLIAADISPDGLDTAISRAKALNSNAETLKIIVDVTSQDAVDAMMAAAVERFGRIDYAVHCAGIACKFGRTDDTNPDEFEHVMSVNFKGLYLCERAALGQMKSQEPRVLENGIKVRGAIVNICSTFGLVGYQSSAPYVTSKHAVAGLTKVDAIDYATDGIRVNAVCPGFIRTGLLEDKDWESIETGLKGSVPMGRFGLIEEVAAAVLFLAGDSASFITGAFLTVDGGFTCK